MKVESVLAPGVYRMDNGTYRVVARVGDRKTGPPPKEKRFPTGTALRVMRRWQEDMRAELRRLDLRPVKGTLAEDVERYLKLMEPRLVSFKDRARDLKEWLKSFGHRHRHTLEPNELQSQLNEWRTLGLSPQTCNLRRTALSHLFSLLDGKKARNPVSEVSPFKRPLPQPQALPYEVIRATFEKMRANPTKARLMLMAYAGFRPSEIQRAEPGDVYLDAPEPYCYKRVGKGGRPLMVPLPPEGVDAWKLFIQLDVWGKYAKGAANRHWQSAMKRAGYLPAHCYTLRHSYATQLLLKGTDDLALVQEALGHRDLRTTRIYTTVKVNPRLVAAVKKAFAS